MAEDTGKSIRSVIKNATLGGGADFLKRRLEGKWNTIATKKEIDDNKSKVETPKMSSVKSSNVANNSSVLPQLWGWLQFWPKFWINGQWLNLKKTESTPKSEVVLQTKASTPLQSTVSGGNVSQQTPVSSPFQNNINTPINNIDVEQINGDSIKENFKRHNIDLRMGVTPVSAKLKELDKDKKKRLSKGIESLYIDAYNLGVDGGELTVDAVENNKEYQKMLAGIDKNVLSSIVSDANYLAQWDYDADNVLALMDKYKDLGLTVDIENLSPQTKAQYISAMLNENKGGLGWVIDHISPFNIAGEFVGWLTWTNPRDYNQQLQQSIESNKQDFLTDEELDEMTKDLKDEVERKYRKYYKDQTEEMFTDRRIGVQFYKDVNELRKKNKGMTEEEAVAKVMKEGKYLNSPYEIYPHEKVVQWKVWEDKDMEKAYNKEMKEIEKRAKKEHWDTTINWIKNLWLDASLVVSQGLDLVRNPWTLITSLAGMAKWAGHKAIEGYADLLDTWIATTEDAIDVIKGEKDADTFWINYKIGSVGEKVAKSKGYSSYDEMVERMERESEDNPALWVATWFLKQGQKDLGMANALGDYFVASYGSLEKAEQTAKENPVQMASDIISIIQLGTLWAAKMGIIDAKKANDIVRIAGYGDLYEQTLKWGNKLQYWPVLKAELAAWKLAAKWLKLPYKFGKNILEVFVNRLSWLTKEERDFIKNNPELTEEFLKWDKNSQTLLDRIKDRFDGLQLEKKLEGEEYDKIRNSNKLVEIGDMISEISKRLKKWGLELTDKWVEVKKNYTSTLNNKFGEMWDFINELRNLWNSATAEDVWWTRRQIDTLAKWEGQPAGLEADAINLIRDIRGILDSELKKQVPSLKDLDKTYISTINEIKELKQDWFNKDGTLRDTAYSKIRNITKRGSNQPKLARLEKLLPWISEELRGLAVAESVEKAGKQMVGQYASQIFWVGGWIAAITSLFNWGLSAWPLILWALGATLATPKNFVKLLKFQGNISKGFNNIIDKISNGIKLTPWETLELTRFLNNNTEELKKDAEYMYRKGLITDEEYKEALKNKEKGVKTTWKELEKEYNEKDNLNSNQNKDGRIEEGKNDTRKGEENLWGLQKKGEEVKQGWDDKGGGWKAWNNGGGISQEDGGFLELNTDWAKVVENLERIKASNPDWYKMDIHWVDDYGNWKRKTFQSKDGNSSITIKDDGDITSLVSKPWGWRGKNLVLTAIKNWGDKLDCYADFLPEFYQDAGFEPVARVKFNPEYAPADWKGKGQDIIVMMRRNNDAVETVDKNWWKYEHKSLENLPVMEYDEALTYRDMLLEERKKSYKPRKVETVQETVNWLKRKKEWVWPNKPIWEETINKDTWKPYTAEEVNVKVEKIRDKYLGDEKALRKLYNDYVKSNTELKKELQGTFKKEGYINPDGLRPLINKEIAKELWVSDNIMASTNHPAVQKIIDGFVDMVSEDMVKKAKGWDEVNVALIWGGGWSWKSRWPKAMIEEGFLKEWDKVDMTLDVQGGAKDLKGLIEKARDEWVLDKFKFKIAYVYASTEEAGKWVIGRTIRQNEKILEKQGLNPKVVEKETDIGKDRLYAWRTLPFKIFEEGHLKSVGEKWLRGYIDIAKDVDNVEFMITERSWKWEDVNKYVVKQWGEWKMTEKEVNDLAERITKNKEAWLNWKELEKAGQDAVRSGKLSKRQYANLFGRLWAFAFLLMVLGGWNSNEA